MKTTERRTYELDSVEIMAGDDDKPRTIIGHAAVFDKLSENLGGFREKIDKNAFDDVLNDDVRALFNHNPDMLLGRTRSGTVRISVDGTGLRYEVDLPDTQIARDLSTLMDRGDVNQSSFAFRVDEDDWQEDDEGRITRTIKKVRSLFDVSPVTYPAYQDADAGIRSLQEWRSNNQTQQPNFDIMKRRIKLAETEQRGN